MVIVPVAYGRMSRADLKRGETEENHLQILFSLAERWAVPLRREQVIFEVESSDQLDTREGIMRLLEMAGANLCTHVLTYDVSRMTRGMEDHWAQIKRAFFRGNITLLTPRAPAGGYVFDNRLDTTILDMEAVLARRYRWEYSVKRQDHNLARTMRGERSSGNPPYGYRSTGATYDSRGNQLTRGTVYAEPVEFVIAQEIWRRIRYEGMRGLATDFNRRQIPTPYLSRGIQRKNNQGVWRDRTIWNIVTNPFYAGHVGHRTEVKREVGQVLLPRSEWVISPIKGEWPTLITLEEYHEVQSILAQRSNTGFARYGLLTNIMRCSHGARMFRGGPRYRCQCLYEGKKHQGTTVESGRFDGWVRGIIEDILGKMDPAKLPAPKESRNRAAVAVELDAARRALSQKKRQLDDLFQRSGWYLSLPDFGQERYEANVTGLAAEGEGLKLQIEEMEKELARPDEREARKLLETARGNRGKLWEFQEGWGFAQMRELVKLIVESVTIEPEEGKHFINSARVRLQPWFDWYVPPALPRISPGRPYKPSPKEE